MGIYFESGSIKNKTKKPLSISKYGKIYIAVRVVKKRKVQELFELKS